MSKNQFIYSRLVPNPKKTEETPNEPDEISLYDSFNVNKVIRTFSHIDGTAVVLLDDGHEESQDKPVPGKKGMEFKRERSWLASHIELNSEDAQRFRDMFSV